MQGVVGDPNLEGIIPRVIKYIFDYIENSNEKIEFLLKVSMVEIYMERLKDLLNPDEANLKIREDKNKGIYIEDLTEENVTEVDEVIEIMSNGLENRVVSCTGMNEQSSRSHSLFILSIKQTQNSDSIVKTGKLYLVDLAGSEKIAKTG
jgi:kinesin family protein 5